MKESSTPPSWANRFLEWYCKPELLEDLQGAFFEYYNERIVTGNHRKAKWMFILDVFMHFRPHIINIKSQNSNTMLLGHFKVSFRNIRKQKLSSILNTVGLSSGLACFILIFLWVNKEVNYDTFHEKGDRIYRISNTFKSDSETFSQAPSGPALGAQLDDIFSEIEESARFTPTSERISVNNQYFFESGLGLVDHNFLEIFDFNLISGNKNTALSDPQSIILTESLAKKYFGDKNPIGESVELDQIELIVTGLMEDPPETSQMQFKALIPLLIVKQLWNYPSVDEDWGGGSFQTYLLLSEGTDPTELGKKITAFIGEKLADWVERGMSYEYFLQPLGSIHLESNLRYDYQNGDIRIVLVFIAVAIVILLLACINYINLATANAINRSKEVGIRKVIGAERKQLILQYLVESFLIVSISVVIALGLVVLVLPYFQNITGYEQFMLMSLDHIVYLVCIVLLLTFIAGLLPAFLISKVSAIKVIKGNLKSGTQYSLLRKGLVITQFTATVVLLISILVMNDQVSFIENKDLGMKTDGVVHINFRGHSEVRNQVDLLRQRFQQLPTVNSVSFVSNSYPVYGLSNSTTDVETGEGTTVTSSIYTLRVDPDFSKTLEMEMITGRFYSKEFKSDSAEAIVVNEACINSFGWKDANDAIGKKFGSEPYIRKVIGVVRNFNFEGLYKRIEPARILPVWNNRYSSLLVNVDLSDPTTLYAKLEATWEEMVPTVPFDATFMDDDLRNQYTIVYNFQSIFVAFSFISVVIGCLGLFGLATATTNRRIREVGIRKVLGASVYEILTMINKDFLYLIIISGIVASPVAYLLMKEWLDIFTYHVTFDVLFIVYALIGAIALTIITVSIKAYKTALANPAHVLKDE